MGIKVDSRLTQTENLNKLLEDAGIGADRRRDFESISILEEDNTVNGESYNTQIQMHLIHGSPTHRKEKKTFASSVYNRMHTGWNNDRGYVFNYDESVRKPLNKDKKAEDLKNLAAMVNESDKLSQDTKYPFRVNVNEAYTEIEVIPHLASPCYYGKKKYPLKVQIDKTNEPIFEPEVYVISALGIPGAKWVNSDLKQTVSIPITTGDVTRDVDVLVIPYKQRIDGTIYSTPLAIDNVHINPNAHDQTPPSFYLIDSTGEKADFKTTLLGIGKPYKDQRFSDLKKENLTRLVTKNRLEDILTVNKFDDTYSRISNEVTQLVVGTSKKYKINILKLKLSEIFYTILENHVGDETLVKEGDKFVLTTDQSYRNSHYRNNPSLERIVFKVEKNYTSDNELIFVFEDQTMLPSLRALATSRRFHRLFDYAKVNGFLRMLRKVIHDDLIAYGFDEPLINRLFGAVLTPSDDQITHYTDKWYTIEDSFLVVGYNQKYYKSDNRITDPKYLNNIKLPITDYEYEISYPDDDYIDYRMKVTFKRT